MSGIEIFDQAWSVPARTVDMLGRQQIANIPTALHELFKNAHDAFADQVVADFFRADRTLVIRDDGDGMTDEQLRGGWLTLASSAKHGANDDPTPRQDGKPRRAIMGEKGIGRLAIASIGPQVLILTRARDADLLVSLVHWGMNELPDVDLSRITIPTMRLPGGTLPDAAGVAALADRLAANVKGLRTELNSAGVDRILGDLDTLDVDPAADLARLPGPSLTGNGHGTHFVVTPTSDMLESDLERPDHDMVSQVEKYLLGFSNTMMPDRPTPAIVATFNDHRTDGIVDTPIGEGAFFTPDDFAKSDHSVEGSFDPFGQFRGTIRVYGGAPREHEIHWPGGNGAPTRCGPFRINFAYVQGLLKDTRLDAETWAEMSAKLNLMGGLYVYRDGIRILPYGGPEQDFVGLERQRTKSASDAFFSYRRIFGAVELSDAENRRLREKAGREGFIRDTAYKDFVSILTNFFSALAIDFFREGSRHADWAETRARLNEQAALLAKREKSAKAKLARFDREIDKAFEKIETGRLTQVAEDIRSDVEAALAATAFVPDLDRAGAMVAELEAKVGKRIDDLQASLSVSKPRGAALNQRRTKDWNAYAVALAKVSADILAPLRANLRERITEVVDERGLALDRRRRIADALGGKGDRARAATTRLRTRVDDRMALLRGEVERTLKKSVSDLAARITETQVEFAATDVTSTDEREVGALQDQWERAIEASARDTASRLEALAEQLDSLMAAVKRGETLDQTTDAIETRSEAYREELDRYVELAQLGTAVGIVQHEFASAVKSVRGAIRRLDPWARANPALGSLSRDLRNGFEHLDAYLNLFAPLSRRLTATRIEIAGGEIENYLNEVFRDRLLRHGISLQASDAYRAARLAGQPSAILAAFVNVVDNAIHWTSGVADSNRFIALDVDGNEMTISNSGPGIDPRIADRIFEQGETTRLGGRGLGLYVSREALRRSDLDLRLTSVGRRASPVFRIGPRKTDDEGSE